MRGQPLYQSSGIGGSVASLIGMLLTVVAVLALAYWVTRLIGQRGMSGWAKGPAGSDKLQVLWQISVGKTERLVLVRLNERCLLLGVASGGISVLAELSKEEAACWLQKRDEAAQPPSFLEVLRGSLPKKK